MQPLDTIQELELRVLNALGSDDEIYLDDLLGMITRLDLFNLICVKENFTKIEITIYDDQTILFQDADGKKMLSPMLKINRKV